MKDILELFEKNFYETMTAEAPEMSLIKELVQMFTGTPFSMEIGPLLLKATKRNISILQEAIPPSYRGIWKCLDVSTCHISEEDDRLLKERATRTVKVVILETKGFYITRSECGWFMTLTYEGEPLSPEEYKQTHNTLYASGFSDGLLSISVLAAILKCAYARMDSATRQREALPIFSW